MYVYEVLIKVMETSRHNSSSSSSSSSNSSGNIRKRSFAGRGSSEEEEDEVLKRRITGHPLYQLLVHTHLDCLKVGLGKIDEIDATPKFDSQTGDNNKHNANIMLNAESELDRFMEAYCGALQKLKEAVEEPQEETMAFINSMHSQLRELMSTTHSAPPQPLPNSSGESSRCEEG
ncbi:homeobox protein knotted-1-like 1 [Malania oleifera]|uniref:homeobox protein knotted-1-like 1 n=1 Tax=Malania oleifera TaxID=397392 RepID=UPI0025AEA614|nr:homeobox protein knotted-1-like 1 [Malania oleifera]